MRLASSPKYSIGSEKETNMSDKSLDNAFHFFLLSMMLLAFAFGINVGEALEKRRHCEALAKTSAGTQAASCRDQIR